MPNNAKNFARLEVIDGRQILMELISDNDTGGPTVRVRRDDVLSIVVVMGPWEDTEEGWNMAEATLNSDISKITEMANELDSLGSSF